MKKISTHLLTLTLLTTLLGLQPTPLPAQTNDPLEAAAPQANANDINTNAATTNQPAPALTKRRGPVISIGGSATTTTGEWAEVVVAIGGSARAGDKVQDAVVAIGGDAEAASEVGDAVVAIGGTAVARGKVGDALVAIAGDAELQGAVGDAVVAILGNVRLGSNAVVQGDVVAVGGRVEVAQGAQINGEIVEVSVAQYPLLAPLKGAADWLRHCALKFRLLAPQAGWYWIFVGGFLLLYLLLAVAIPRPIAACVNELTQRPATTLLIGLLIKLLIPMVLIVLAITGIGMIVVPFVLAAIFIAALIGKAALFEYLGGKILGVFGVPAARPILALLVGFALITCLYMIPLVSLLIYTMLGLWALGTAVTATFTSARSETPPRPPYPPAGFNAGTSIPPSGEAATTQSFTPNPAATTPHNESACTTMPVPEAYAWPRAGFWERVGAAFLDLVIVAILSVFVGGLPFGLLVALAYSAGMWAWKGATIGGIVLNLKVVRLDAQPVTFAVALVRGLATMLSGLVFFLGFFWIMLDREKQAWHDKIAGTVVVRTPRAIPLVCL